MPGLHIVVGMSDEMDAALAVGGEAPDVVLAGRRREQDSTRRTLRLTPRFSVSERAEIAVAAARGMSMSYGAPQDREALARLQRQLFEARTAVNRFGNNVNQAVAAFHSTGQALVEALAHAVALCARAVSNLDELVDELHRRLR